MKQITKILIIFFVTNTFAQKVDLVNAPLNPIVLKYKLEHFNLKGDVYNYDFRFYFNKEGFLVSKSDSQGDNTYTYKNGKLEYDGLSLELKVNDQGFVTFRKRKYDNNDYTYNDKGLLTSEIEIRPASYNKPLEAKTKKYVYDTQNRVIKQEEYVSEILKETKTYSYKKVGNTLQVAVEVTETGKKPYRTEKHYVDGRLILSNDQYDDIPLKIETKLDVKGNSIEDKHINGGELIDTFNYSIVYYSDASKLINYNVFINKAYNGDMIPQIYRNGTYFYSPFKVMLEASKDMLFYDDLTKNYYLAKNAYDKTLTEGTNINFELVGKNSEALVQTFPNNRFTIYYKCENILLKSINAKASYSNTHLFCYLTDKNTSKKRTFFFRKSQEKPFSEGEILPDSPDHLYYYIDGATNADMIIYKGESILRTTFSDFKNLEGGGKLGYVNNVPTYTFPEYFSMENDKIYVGRLYDAKIDKLQTISNQETGSSTTTSNCISGNCIDGYGTFKYDNSTIDGFFKGGKANGYGNQVYDKSSYSGNFKNGDREGFGIYYWTDTNQYYIGEWKTGKQNGYGYYRTNDVITHAGYYENGIQVANMIDAYANNISSNGCKGNCVNGFGELTYNDGAVVVGFFKNSKINGPANMSWTSKDVYIGNWIDSGRIGHGMYLFKSLNTTYYGDFSNNKLNGLGVYFDKDTKIISKGYWVDGKIQTNM